MQTSFFDTQIDLSNVDPGAGSFEPVPAGWYVSSLSDIETKKKDGALSAKCIFDITEGPLAGRKVFENNMLFAHPTSEMAHNIGQRKLRQWIDAIGIDPRDFTSAEPLLGATVMIKVSVQQPRTDQRTGKTYGSSNRVDAFRVHDGMPPQPAKAPAPAPIVRAPAAPMQRPVAQAQARPATTFSAQRSAPQPQASAGVLATGQAKPMMPWMKRSGAPN